MTIYIFIAKWTVPHKWVSMWRFQQHPLTPHFIYELFPKWSHILLVQGMWWNTCICSPPHSFHQYAIQLLPYSCPHETFSPHSPSPLTQKVGWWQYCAQQALWDWHTQKSPFRKLSCIVLEPYACLHAAPNWTIDIPTISCWLCKNRIQMILSIHSMTDLSGFSKFQQITFAKWLKWKVSRIVIPPNTGFTWGRHEEQVRGIL